MVFSSILFLFLFLPVTIVGYYISPKPLKNGWLLLASFIFFAWGGVAYSLLLIISVVWNYVFGILINKNLHNVRSKIYLIIGVTFNLFLLCTFKYGDFLVDNLNVLLSLTGSKLFPNPAIVLPIGISFYTFQSLSYLVDVFRGELSAEQKITKPALYISFFPQLIAGPIIRYSDIAGQLNHREHTTRKFSDGVERFAIGLAKKVLLANTFAVIADQVFAGDPSQLNALNAWIGIVAYTLQIYFDFSGYSDMAIGLAGMFGFTFPENFNFPYIAKSIKEFWHRWHISLSTWFRDYLYIPLGGNRKGNGRTYVNLIIVFLATGFWHGASWTFVVWGLYHGFFLVVERMGFSKIIGRLPGIVASFYTLQVIMLGWVLFRADSFSYAAEYYKALFRFEFTPEQITFFNMHVTVDFWVALVIGWAGALGVVARIQKQLVSGIEKLPGYFRFSFEMCYAVFIVGLVILSSVYLIAGTHNPFIYYRF